MFQPIKPMLAYDARLESLNPSESIVDVKVDGIRAQVHKSGETVRLYSRWMKDITNKFPSVVKAINEQVVGDCILDGEIVGEGNFRNVRKNPELRIFDILFLNEEKLINKPLMDRRNILYNTLKFQSTKLSFIEHAIPQTINDIKKFYIACIAKGYEGIMIKDLHSRYRLGRSFDWLKLKPRITLDLVIVEAFYGKGIFSDMLSQYLVACRDGNRLLKFGKVYSGLTVQEKKDLTKILESFATDRKEDKLIVNPEIVLEISCRGFEKSDKWDLPFIPRGPVIVKIRYDKPPVECDIKEKVMKYAEWFSV